MSLSRSLRNAGQMALDLALGAYPRFVYGGQGRGVPVFTTHGVEPELFEKQLRFLSDNGYRTLSADEYFEVTSGARTAPDRSVMLTYDDGLGSLWSVGLPLLQRYKIKIVVFLIPARIPSDGLGPTLEDLKAGRCDEAAVIQRDSGTRPFLSWQEIKAMHDTGLVDFQSHTLNHAQVFASSRLETFFSPDLAARLTRFQIPEWQPGQEGVSMLGRPLYATQSRMRVRHRYIPSREAREACEGFVFEHGGKRFFERRNWRRRLSAVYHAHRGHGRFESDLERDAALYEELYVSKRMIEERLPGKTVRHLAYPWGMDSKRAIELSAQAGYMTNFPAKVSGSYDGVRPGSPLVAARFGMDFLFRLPGRGRRSLAQTLRGKLTRNIGYSGNGASA